MFLYINATAYETAIYVEEGVEQDGHRGESIRAAFARARPRAHPEHDVNARGADGREREKLASSFGIQLMIEGLLHIEPPDIP